MPEFWLADDFRATRIIILANVLSTSRLMARGQPKVQFSRVMESGSPQKQVAGRRRPPAEPRGPLARSNQSGISSTISLGQATICRRHLRMPWIVEASGAIKL